MAHGLQLDACGVRQEGMVVTRRIVDQAGKL